MLFFRGSAVWSRTGSHRGEAHMGRGLISNRGAGVIEFRVGKESEELVCRNKQACVHSVHMTTVLKSPGLKHGVQWRKRRPMLFYYFIWVLVNYRSYYLFWFRVVNNPETAVWGHIHTCIKITENFLIFLGGRIFTTLIFPASPLVTLLHKTEMISCFPPDRKLTKLAALWNMCE